MGDCRISSVSVRNPDTGPTQWICGTSPMRLFRENMTFPAFRALYGNPEDADTLKITLKDPVTGLRAVLYYSVWEKQDIITRSVRFYNENENPIILKKAVSMNLDLMHGQWELIHFHGRHCMERQMERIPVMSGKMEVRSTRASSSHHHNPFAILCAPETTETDGPYGVGLVYSGNYSIQLEKDQMNQVRLTAGIAKELFAWQLDPRAEFCTPEAVMTFSGQGLEKLSSNFHHIVRKHLCRGKYKHARRPVLLNNWEATYFDFTGEKILAIAGEAQEVGVEMLVLDDGWFGAGNDDYRGLGDWYVNVEKLPGGNRGLSDQVEALGLKFGLWVELEAVNKDSDLYRAHPDWVIGVPGSGGAVTVTSCAGLCPGRRWGIICTR